MSEPERLSDEIIRTGPFVAGQVNPLGHTTAARMNELRDELVELRAIVDKVENDQCGCLGGPLSIEWARASGEDDL